MNAFAFIWFSKDGVTKYGLNLLLTNKRMIFIDYSLFGGSGWHLRENIFYDDIISLSAAKHVLGINEKPTLFITTTQHSYEIGFFHILPDSEIVQINKVLAIIDCIKKRNPHIETQVTFQNKLKDMFFMWR